MNEISIYLMSIVGVVMLVVAIDLILPDSKISKYIKGIVSIFVVAVIVSPVISIVKGDFDWKSIFTESSYQVDENIMASINNQNIQVLQDELSNCLQQNGYKGVEVMISTNFINNEIKINYIYVNLCDLVLNENIEHIDYYTNIKELIKKQINIEEDKIVIYG